MTTHHAFGDFDLCARFGALSRITFCLFPNHTVFSHQFELANRAQASARNLNRDFFDTAIIFFAWEAVVRSQILLRGLRGCRLRACLLWLYRSARLDIQRCARWYALRRHGLFKWLLLRLHRLVNPLAPD